MHLLLTLLFALDLAGIKAEPKLEKRSELALHYADTQLDAARDAYKKGDVDASKSALAEVEAAVQLSYDALMATGKDPRRNSKPFKDAEKSTRQILRRWHARTHVLNLGALHDFIGPYQPGARPDVVYPFLLELASA